jgi:late competence protein required for DNA uptake (superfamily II DNA/RNA helicase)
MNEEELYQKLVTLLKLFKNRPYHLAKYLMDNSAFNKNFLNKISKSTKLDELINNEEENKIPISIYFSNISQMEKFYESLLEEIKEMKSKKSPKEIIEDLNSKLDELIKTEKFEEAAKLRDYMKKNSIKRITKD